MTGWSFAGYDLTSFGKVTLIDDYLDMPTRRGNNQVIPFRHGSVFVEKYYDERTLSFGIAVSAETIEAMESLMETLRGILAVRTQQSLAQTLTNGTVRTAQASVDRPLQVNRPAPNIALLVVEFTLCEPFFRLSTAIADNTTVINASPKAMTVTNPGTVDERNPTIILTGPLVNTVITNSTNGAILTYTGSIPSPRVVTISKNSSGEFVATDDLGTNVIGNITHSGAPEFLPMNVGANTLSITDGVATTGSVKITFNAPYL